MRLLLLEVGDVSGEVGGSLALPSRAAGAFGLAGLAATDGGVSGGVGVHVADSTLI
jgi:hypothetical protein